MKLIVFLNLVLCLSAVAQPNPINRRAMAIAGLAKNPSLFDGLVISNRWISQSFCTNQVGVTTWIDETNHFYWTNGASPLTNTINGVWLDHTHYFVGTNIMTYGDLVQFFIFDWQEPTLGSLNDTLFQDGGLGLGFPWFITGVNPYHVGFGFNNPQSTFAVVPNSEYNVIWTGSGQKCYTNGVDAQANNVNYGNSGGLMYIGSNPSGSQGFNGTLKELITFTNKTISSSQISNLNYYAQHYPVPPVCNPTPCVAGVTTPTGISGLALRWIASDLSNGSVIDWIDRVQSNHLVQASVGNQPTKGVDGVTFADTQFLNSTNWTITNGKDSLFMVFKSPSDAGHDYWIIVRTAPDRLNVNGGGVNTMSWTTSSAGSTAVTVPNFNMQDFAYYMGTSPSTNVFYTNGVFSSGGTSQGAVTDTVQKVGGVGNAFSSFLGSIQEICYYTNVTFTADNICSLHYYATNTYGFTP